MLMIFPWSMAISWSVAIFEPAANEPSKRLIGVFSSEINKSSPEWAGRDGDDQTAHLDVFANVLNGFRVLDHARVVRVCCNQADQQTENRKQWTHVGADYSLEF
jgi:hypothetical protein